jgi:phosphatidate cytidylyltransferase
MNEPVHLVFYFVMGLIGGLIGIIGDLAASFIKRECGIKDFGSLMPGHGGALDRLDSVLFTATFAAFAFKLFFDWFSVVPAGIGI